MTETRTHATAPPALVVHADWSTHAAKRWMAAATLERGRYRAHAPEPVGDPATLMARLRDRAPDGGAVLAGFDFPIGLPARYAHSVGVTDFLALLPRPGEGAWARFYDVARAPDEVGPYRPFYPHHRFPGVTQRHLLDGVGLQSMRDLLRACDLGHEGRRTATSIFWTFGPQQVGKATIHGWRDVLAPALRERAVTRGSRSAGHRPTLRLLPPPDARTSARRAEHSDGDAANATVDSPAQAGERQHAGAPGRGADIPVCDSALELPRHTDPVDVALWPFDGKLADLLAPGRVVVAEVYPGECYGHLGVSFALRRAGERWGKLSRPARALNARPLLDWARGAGVALDADLRAAVEDGFGEKADGDDRFDCTAGLFAMLNVALGLRPLAEPSDGVLRRVEGWMFGRRCEPADRALALTPLDLGEYARRPPDLPLVAEGGAEYDPGSDG